MNKYLHRSFILVVVLLVAVACRQEASVSAENVDLDVSVTDSLVGDTTLVVTVTDDEGNPIENPGTLSLRGDMNHAGMIPVIREASDATNGVFTVPFEWTMGGAWILEATLTLPNDEVVTETFNYEILAEASEDDDMGDMTMSADDSEDGDSEMDHSEMDMSEDDDSEMDHSEMDMSEDDDSEMDHDHSPMGETSAVYMTITNDSDADIMIMEAQTTVAEIVEIHETVIENDVARMEAVGALMIPAGETVELRPAGKHIMLMQLTEDIVAGNEIEVELVLESGDTFTVSAVVQDMLMDELDGEIESNGLTVTNIWARPASSGMSGMNHSDMDMSEEDDSEMDHSDMDMSEDATEEAEMDMSESSMDSGNSLWQSLVSTTGSHGG